MTKIWHIIKHEYIRHVLQKRFLFSLLSLPFGLIAMIGIGALVAWLMIDTSPVGYVDHAGILKETTLPEQSISPFDPEINLIEFSYENEAKDALDSETIQAYYVISAAYPEVNEIQLVYFDSLGSEYQFQFMEILRRNIPAFDDIEPAVKTRLAEGSQMVMVSLDESREIREDQFMAIMMPFASGLLFFIVIMTSGGYLLQAVVEEKENRTMEIVITSVSPGQLMTGKVIGNIGVGLTQLVVWLLFGWLAIIIGGQFWPPLQDFSIPAGYMGVLFLVLLPSFVMVAAIMATIGATVTETQEAQQASGLFALPLTIPYYLTSFIMMNPNGTLATVLSYFPLTAPITILMRMAFTVVPLWQIALNITILVVFAILSLWFAGRAFRLGMLQYGKKLPLKAIFTRRSDQ